MLQLESSLQHNFVLSLRTSQPVAKVTSPIINPKNLKIEGYYCTDIVDGTELVLLFQDIREILAQGFVINDFDVLAQPEDLIRLQDVMAQNITVKNQTVKTVDGEKIGKVSDFAVETETMYIQKIYVSRSILKSFSGGSLSIDRSQVVDVTNRTITINNLLKDATVRAAVPAV